MNISAFKGVDESIGKPLIKSAKTLEKSVESGIIQSNNIINLDIDKLVPCLEDAQTGKILQTEVKELERNSLYKYKEKNGWGVDWNRRPENEYVLGGFIKGEDEPQGLVSLRKD